MKQMEVTIVGQSYILACPDGGEAHLLAAVARVDQEMAKIRDAGKVRARERMAVLAALNLAYALSEGETARAAAAPAAPAALSASADTLARLVERIDDALGEDGRLL